MDDNRQQQNVLAAPQSEMNIRQIVSRKKKRYAKSAVGNRRQVHVNSAPVESWEPTNDPVVSQDP